MISGGHGGSVLSLWLTMSGGQGGSTVSAACDVWAAGGRRCLGGKEGMLSL